jgi:hypothetical protein
MAYQVNKNMEQLLQATRQYLNQQIDNDIEMSWEEGEDGWWNVTTDHGGVELKHIEVDPSLPPMVKIAMERYGEKDVFMVQARDCVLAPLIYC